MEASEIQSLMEELQCPSLEMDAEQIANAHKAAAILEDLTAQKCREVIRVAHRGACLQVLFSDGWFCDMRSRTSAGIIDGARVDRVGRMRTEFCLQRLVLKCKTGDQ